MPKDLAVRTTPALQVTGLAGATATSRYVGATISGAPATGNFEAGDFVVTLDGTIWICVANGSPGTWEQVSGSGGGGGGVDILQQDDPPASPADGDLWIDTDEDGIVANEAWTAWTPTWTNFTPGSSTIVARYQRIGRTIHWRMSVTLAGAFSVGDVRFTLPAVEAPGYFVLGGNRLGLVGQGELLDLGGSSWHAHVRLQDADSAPAGWVRLIYFPATAGAAIISSTVPFTWGAGDGWDIGGTYEALT